MAFRDLREFITLLEQRGELIRIKAPVNPELEITEITDRVSKGPVERNMALLFENVTGSALPVLINAFGSARRMARALGVEDLDELNHPLAAVLDLRLPQGLRATLDRAGDMLGVLRSIGLGPLVVSRAPCQQVIRTGDDLTLSALPILKCWPQDGGRTITLPQVITRDPALAADGYHLTSGSAAIDAGVEADVTTDIDENPRPIGRPDLGADEWGTRVYLPLVLRNP
jgi:4-hydroxy-3-polyprenylbenzoate decarboxylase